MPRLIQWQLAFLYQLLIKPSTCRMRPFGQRNSRGTVDAPLAAHRYQLTTKNVDLEDSQRPNVDKLYQSSAPSTAPRDKGLCCHF